MNWLTHCPSKVEAANKYLESLVSDDAFLEALRNAPMDDEPLTEEDLRAIEEAEDAIARSETEHLEDVMREFGL